MPTNRPNIVLIISDQHNKHVLGCAGHPYVLTPNLDQLAASGARMTNVYCPYPLCAPSRAGFMSAQYPSDIGVYDNGGSAFFSSQTPTFAHALGAAGYEAVLCGRMHFGSSDPFHGFERRIHGDAGGQSVSREILGTGINRTNGQTKYAVEVAGYGRNGFQAFDASVTQTACDFIANRSPDDRPYVLVVGLMLPHNPLICSKEDFEYYAGKVPIPEPEPPSAIDRLHPAVKRWRERRGVDDLTPEQNHRAIAAYLGLVTELDRNIGRMVDVIRSSDAETAIAYTSDHGDMCCEHGMWWKSNFYEGSAGVPLIASLPGRFPAGTECDDIASLIDVGPTLLDLAGAPPLPDVSGQSFLRLLENEPIPDWPDQVFCEYAGLLGDRPSCMVRTGQWKLNYYSEFDSCQLFDLASDPEERNDLAGRAECAVIVNQLKARIDSRWSAQDIQDGMDRQQRATEVLKGSGHHPQPHDVSNFVPEERDNQFDFSQLTKKPVGMDEPKSR
jgi:choline-sulfatase